jgi:hypothetical protein
MYDRELVDAWSGALAAAAEADPAAFLAATAGREVGTTELTVLGAVDDRRATGLLWEYATHLAVQVFGWRL